MTDQDPMRKETRELTPEEKNQIDTVKQIGNDLFNLLVQLGESRALSIAKTKIEEGVMWAVKHLTQKK
jgi:hypothetical protein